MGIFSGVAYTLSSSLRASDQEYLSGILDANGATQSSLENATHIISDTLEFEGWQSASENAEVVTLKWAQRSVALGKRQMAKYYSADPSMLFSGVCACATEIDPSDVEVLSGAIVALGGQWRQGLTREVTHLFAMGTTSDKFQTAEHYQKDTLVKILVPHWFDDVVRLGVATIPTLQYEWPDPKVLQLAPPSPKGKKAHKPPQEKASLYKSIVLGNSEDGEIPENLGKAAERIDVWKGKRVLLSVSLELNPGRREAVVAGVKRFGGAVVDVKSASDEAKKVENVDVLITKFRAGAAYFKALKRTGIIVGNLCWLFHVQTIRAISPPTDQLLHYPTPSREIEGFDEHEITVTNYTGEAREYLKRLIMTMGARFTPNMSLRNTVVIAAYKSGTKTDRAAQWSIPVVNHTWLEDCFVNWRNLSVGHEKYVRFSPTCDCSGFLGDKGIGRKVILDDAERSVPTQDFAAPTGSIKEVEEAIAVDENDLGTNSEHPHVKGEAEDVEMVDNDAPDVDVDVDMEVAAPPKHERTASPSPTAQKRRRSGNTKPSVTEENDPRAHNPPALAGRRTHSQVEVVVPPRPDYGSPMRDNASARVKKSASRKLVASESPVSVKRSSPVKAKTPGRKSIITVGEEEEEEPVSAKRAPLKRTQKRKRNGSESEEEHERPEKPTPGPSNPKPTQSTRATQPHAQESPPPTHPDGVPSRGRRSAAQKADKKLKDIMPDVINFEKQMKRGTVVSEWERATKEQERVDKKAKEKEKSKENAGEKLKKTKRRRSDVSTEEEEEEGDDEPSTSKAAGGGVHIMTTKIQVPEDTKKALTKLGAKFTDKPLECTHLIVGAFGRTEKLLSSIAVAPFILREEWLTKSAAKRRFLPEKEYSLEDRETEAKYAFKMTKTLERARKNKGKLLEGKTFYLTQKVDVDKKLMKNVVAAHGGTLLVQTPTYRMVTSKPDRYVISCEDDGSIWRAIAENDIPIYTKELILSGILKQEVAWDDHEFMVPGSY